MKLKTLSAKDYNLPDLRRKPIYKKDSRSGGWIAYYDNVPVIAQGENKKDAFKNLKRDIREISAAGLPLYQNK